MSYSIKQQGTGIATCVLDTSFLVNFSARMRWTLELGKLMMDANSEIVIPIGVKNEFDDLLKTGLTDNFEVPILYDTLEDVLEMKRFSIYTRALDNALSPKLDGESEKTPYKNPKPLTITDKSLVQAVLEYAEKDNLVFAATSDGGIYETLNNWRDEKDLRNVKIYSPWRVPSNNTEHSLETKLLVSGNVFGELHRAEHGSVYDMYLSVARGMHIGGKVHSDIAFCVHKKKMYERFPHIEDIYYIPVIFFTFDVTKQAIKYDKAFLITLPIVTLYSKAFPGFVWIGKQKPLSILEAKKLVAQAKNRELDEDDGGKLLQRLEQEYIGWARIEDDDIKIFDKVTEGKLKELRERLTIEI